MNKKTKLLHLIDLETKKLYYITNLFILVLIN